MELVLIKGLRFEMLIMDYESYFSYTYKNDHLKKYNKTVYEYLGKMIDNFKAPGKIQWCDVELIPIEPILKGKYLMTENSS